MNFKCGRVSITGGRSFTKNGLENVPTQKLA